MDKVVIFGATSRTAQELARIYARSAATIYCVARDLAKLEILQKDLESWGAAEVKILACDFLDMHQQQAMLESLFKLAGTVKTVVIAYGVLGEPRLSHAEASEAEKIYQANFNSVAELCLSMKPILTKNSRVAFLSSVAGDRARRSNFVYGTAKAAMNFFLDGLQLEWQGEDISLVTIKLGPVDTPMTVRMGKMPFMIQPDLAAHKIFAAIEDNSRVVYIPGIWKLIMAVIRHLPYPIFSKINF